MTMRLPVVLCGQQTSWHTVVEHVVFHPVCPFVQTVSKLAIIQVRILYVNFGKRTLGTHEVCF